MKPKLILAIESSCDETAAAVTLGRRVLSGAVASQIDEHRLYGGVVPEIASRRHCENITALTEEALKSAGTTLRDIEAVAVTGFPGLIGALLVGVSFAKGIALARKIPLIPVHHLRAHIAANYIEYPDLAPPFLCLVVSGGHSHIINVRSYTEFEVIGRTRDDAAGECFDKTARAMGLPYPGGMLIDELAENGNPAAYVLPRPVTRENPLDFSFSGLKTAVVNILHNAAQKGIEIDKAGLAASLRARVCEMLTENTFLAAKTLKYDKIVLSGGVAANRELRRLFAEQCTREGFGFFVPSVRLCGDNAEMVGVQAAFELEAGNIAGMDLNAEATRAIDR